MFIEYDLQFKKELCERGVLNCEHIKWIEIEQHGGGYGKAINVYYSGHEAMNVFILDDDEAVTRVYEAFKRALCGEPMDIEGIGYVRPLRRKAYWGADDVVEPVAYGLD